MALPALALFCVGLCAGQDLGRDGSLPRPSIRAWPSWVLPVNSQVTLRCSIPTGEIDFRDIRFAFRKNNLSLKSLLSPDAPGGLAELRLPHLKNSDAGEYTCDYYRTGSPTRRSPPSDVLLLLVTGHLPKPSLQAHQSGEVAAGEDVILQCQKPRHVLEPHMFALLKKGTSTPIKLQRPVGIEADFSLQRVTGSDTGDYSCVYFQPRAPFWASEPSDHLAIWVTDEAESPKGAAVTLGTSEIILIVLFPLFFLLAAILVCKYTCCGAALKKMTKSSHSSKKAEEVVTDASPATKSCSPALDEGPQGVTYAELNTRALSQGPLLGQVPQPLETCVYSVLKM